MKLLFYLIFLIIGLLIFNLIKSKNKGFSKNFIFTLLCTILIFNIVLNPKVCIDSALEGAQLFLNSVFVSLFPFLVLINIMLYYDGVNIYSNLLGGILCKPLKLPRECSVVILISILCGYPLGAKYACELYEKKIISYTTCERLISIASNPSPLFILGAIGTSMLKDPSLGLILLISSYLSCIIMSFLLPSHKNLNDNIYLYRNVTKENTTIGDILKNSIDNAIKTSISIGGFIIFFSVLTAIIKNNILFDIVFKSISSFTGMNLVLLESFFLGLLEMTNGTHLISELNIDILYKLIIISFFIAFSGISIISQTYSITYKYNFPINLYVKRKVLQGLVCILLTLIIYKSNMLDLSQSTFNIGLMNYSSINLKKIFLIEVFILSIPIVMKKLLIRFS
ncbi:sporulation integral membrane protein YlbJ [Clostridium homopropionicum DSM 5847]|uniref:Sporulation integral membrane protein YlbJ n=1 Tax=Clostridium homopropionicum DSM 5847 TaxID=1121318 RepID=A0A0L6ZC29_9CLOT|nr:sporulation integral membrane protein YlbJ [Clostridium homopropionicum]KOA20539.1 sporulation integral membrane protein YlbJ [Clostridium homopropionicum DSM 5847]SFG38081.1 sporulation integral membrane protein YlbJ [Clostridium homopropionicum]